MQNLCPLARREQLDVGDIGYKQVAIELKSWTDFVIALTSKEDDRFRRQLYNFLINKDVDGYYIIYGSWSEIKQFSHINMTAVLGAIASIQARYGMRLSVLPNKEYAVYVALKIIDKTFDHKDVRPVTYRVGSDERAIDGLVAIGERVGTEDGIRLLEHFGTFKDVVNATQKQMVEVHKIGKIKAENLLKVINYDFKSKAEFEEAIDEEFGIIDIENDKVNDTPIPDSEIEIEKVDDTPKPKKKSLLIDSEESEVFTQYDKQKAAVYQAIEMYSEKKNKPCPYDNLKRAVKFKETLLRQLLNDLILESRIYAADKGLYEVY